jgi:23S rRNA (uridine2552-2'-O)-methyltransferase
VNARRRVKDYYARRAKKENYPARSVYKLQAIDQKTRLIRRNDRVVDLGAAPGSWTLYAAERVGKNGLVVAVDRQPLTIAVPDNVRFLEEDIFEINSADLGEMLPNGQRADVVISDMAPKTSGHRFVDQARSFNLFSEALEIAARLLRPGGRFAGKIFQGEDFEAARSRLRELFTTSKVVRPDSVRSESYEIYLVGLNKKRPR